MRTFETIARLGYGVALWDHTLRLSECNDVFADLVGLSECELRRRFMHEISHPETRPCVDEWCDDEAAESFIFRVAKSKRARPIRVLPIPLVDAETGVRASLWLCRPADRSEAPVDDAAKLADLAYRVRRHSHALRRASAALEEFSQTGTAAILRRNLSEREREVLDGLLCGMSRKQIAQEHHVSVHTVRNHAKAIYRKLGVHSQVELLGLFPDGPPSERDRRASASRTDRRQSRPTRGSGPPGA